MGSSVARRVRAQMDAELRSAKTSLRRRGLQLGVIDGNGSEKFFVAWDKQQEVVDTTFTKFVLKRLRDRTGVPVAQLTTRRETAYPGSCRIEAESGVRRHEEGGGGSIELRGRRSGKASAIQEGQSGQTERREEQDPA